MARPVLGPGASRGLAAAGLAATLLLSGCGVELRDVPMPELVSGPTYSLDAVFGNALNLPEQAPVKLDGDVVGEVSSIEVDDFRARVRLRLRESVVLSRGTTASIRLTSAMGEAFVELVPSRRPGPRLRPGDVIGPRSTSTAPDTTDLLSGLSVLVTGGSFADLQVVVSELRTALQGNTAEVRRLLHRLDTLVTGMTRRTGRLDGVLDRLDELAAALAHDSGSIARAVEEITPAVQVLAGQRESAMALLREVAALSRTSNRVIARTRDDLVAQLEAAVPILDTMVRNQRSLRPALTGVSAFAGQLDNATPVDFANFQLSVLLDARVNGGIPLLDLEEGKLPALDPPEWSSPILPLPGGAGHQDTARSELEDLLRGAS